MIKVRAFDDWHPLVQIAALFAVVVLTLIVLAIPVGIAIEYHDAKARRENSRDWIEYCTNLCSTSGVEPTRGRCSFRCSEQERDRQVRK